MNPLLLDLPDTLETERLILRCARPGDGSAVFAAVQDTLDDLRAWPASLPWAQFEPSLDAFEAFCRTSHADYLLRKNLQLLMFLKENNVYIGGNGLHSIDWSVPKFEIGYWCRRQYQGQGLVTEAVRAVTAFAFDTLGAQRVVSLSDARNQPSRAVAERAGYALEGVLKNDRRTPHGLLCDTCVYAITQVQYNKEHNRSL